MYRVHLVHIYFDRVHYRCVFLAMSNRNVPENSNPLIDRQSLISSWRVFN